MQKDSFYNAKRVLLQAKRSPFEKHGHFGSNFIGIISKFIGIYIIRCKYNVPTGKQPPAFLCFSSLLLYFSFGFLLFLC